jgi:hypothetical protein
LTNKQINAAAKSATRLTAELGFKRVLIRGCLLNNDKDGAIEHLTGVKAKRLFWFLHEKIEKRATTCDHLESPTTLYPPELDGYKEPNGLEYARQNNLPNIDQLLQHYHGSNTMALLSAVLPQPPAAKLVETRLTNTPISGSDGASVWNRKEGNLSRTTLNKLKVLATVVPYSGDALGSDL